METTITKVYQVTWFNGEMFFELQERKTMGMFSTMEKAQSYIDKWRENYVKESEEFAIKHNYHQYDDYEFEFYFPEEMWITEYEII